MRFWSRITPGSLPGVNNAYLFMMNYLAQRYHKLSKAYHMLSISSSQLARVGQRFYNFVPTFQNCQGGTGIVQACDSCLILEEELCYVVDGEESLRAWLEGEPNQDMGWRWEGGIKPSRWHEIVIKERVIKQIMHYYLCQLPRIPIWQFSNMERCLDKDTICQAHN